MSKQTDTLSLTGVFEKFPNMCLEMYKLETMLVFLWHQD